MQLDLPKIELVPISSIHKNPKNPRIIKDDKFKKLVNSVKNFPRMLSIRPVVVDESGMILGGNMRYEAALAAGLKDIPIIKDSTLTEDQKKEFIIKDNVSGGEWDVDLLNEWDVDLLNEWGLDLQEDFASEEVEGLTDEDALPDVPADPVTRLGDVWLLGNHRVMCGDSTSVDAVEKLMDGSLADMWLTDPPYNVAYKGKTKDALKIQNDSMGDADFRTFLRDCCVTADTVMKAGAVFYIWHADSEGYNFRGACKDAGWTVRQCLIWNKSSMVMGRMDYHWKHEPCLYGWKDGAGHLWASDRKQVTVLEFNKPQRNGEHPTMKPVELFEYQVLNNTKGSDVVLDSFGGSGTTVIACEKNNRIARVMELDPKYCDVIVKRWQDFTGKEATLEADNRTFAECSK